MAVVCPSCEVLPAPDVVAGARCHGCGAGLVTVTTTEPMIGTIVDGRFEVQARLGAGAMGIVYRATQLSIGRDVALKVLSGIESAPVIKRFFREAKLASALSHPNTVQIIEFGQEPGGFVYLAMELVRGHTLLAELDKGPLASRRITRIGVQLCDALEAAHRLQIVHRDLKLENVMISADGADHIKILDFGIARLVGDASSQVTATGMFAGTPHYMAPEVLAQAVEPAPAQDVYAVGVILAELALGESLWSSAMSLPMLLVEKMAPTAVERVPSRLRPLVGRLLDPDPGKRPPPAELRRLLLELDRFATDPVGVALPTPPAMREVLGAAPTAFHVRPVTPWATLDLVGLDERNQTRQAAPPVSAFEPPTGEAALTLEVVDTGDPLDLDLLPTPIASPRPALAHTANPPPAVTQRGTPAPAPPRTPAPTPTPARPAARGGSWRIGLVVLAVTGGAGAYWYRSTTAHRSTTAPGPTAVAPVGAEAPTPEPESVPPPDARPAPRPAVRPPPAAPTGPVTIRIVGVPGVAITIDGAAAGALPVRLERRAGTRPMVIAGPGIHRRIIPDRSQTVDLSVP